MDINNFDLFTALNIYTPFDDIEAGHVKSVKEFLTHSGDLYSRSHLEGHITGSAFLMNEDMTKLLMTHHKALNKWLQFGGHSDGDTNTLRVGARETEEESGIMDFQLYKDGIFDVDVHTIPYSERKKEPEHKHYDIRFLFTTNECNYVMSDESNDLKWLTLDEFKKLDNNTARDRFIKKWESILLEKSKKKLTIANVGKQNIGHEKI